MEPADALAEIPEAVRFGDRLGLGFSCLEMGLHEEAAHLFEQALCLRPADPAALAHLALCRWQLGDEEGCRVLAARAQGMLAGAVPRRIGGSRRPALRIVR
ncbi:tetratricopeptide repeat protein [Arenibaculum pallidiluteum]|uniref:tetratricopeptide repeat protein n=1 Tax=Arenibaculum pallidiluteum TaxID=2812559 RepID=UPI001A979F79|nr:tetratricopeptide repeat protein [Arenibaculum pallidiluteum]